jgi:hypothetical protein
MLMNTVRLTFQSLLTAYLTTITAQWTRGQQNWLYKILWIVIQIIIWHLHSNLLHIAPSAARQY